MFQDSPEHIITIIVIISALNNKITIIIIDISDR